MTLSKEDQEVLTGMDKEAARAACELTILIADKHLDKSTLSEISSWIVRWKRPAGYKRLCKVLVTAGEMARK